MNKEDVKNKEDLIHYILLDLYKKVYPVKFGEYFIELSLSGGIDNFRNLLEELHENKLLIKTSESGGDVQGLPGIRTVDLRYGISLNGIQYLKDNGLIFSKSETKMKKEVFVTYSWDSEEHNEKVLSFTNYLRDEGFGAEMDKLYTQQETAGDFYKMMHQAMTDYEKVIVVLSRGYKQKAENFKGGVGNEYNLIIKDIEANPRKYILVAFEPYSDEIVPLQFKGRQVLNVTDKNDLNELFAKLQNENTIEFSEVGTNKPVITKKSIPKFEVRAKKIKILGILSNVDNASQFSNLYKKIEFDLNLEIQNETGETISDYTIEVLYPVNSTSFEVNGKIAGNKKTIAYDTNPKLFPNQTRTFKLENLTIRNSNAAEILKDCIEIKIYSAIGTVTKEYQLTDVLLVKDIYGEKNLTIDMFLDRNYH